ncbi:translation initiation factor IF-2 [uncultured Fenollaria sp.]|uniref:translation initiation factor IF-2 n=1 Tax=uncultured Fenollaria sp. TaxID=1686315 RepID=UPI0025F5F691|nr:translation initiation factor IF-2 [uncultured Fenollaria sp.]
MKTRVYELAKELNMETKELLDKLQELNLPPMTNLSGIDEETANMVRDLFLEEDKVAVKERPKKKIRKAKEDTESIDKKANKAKKSAKPEVKKTNVKENTREEAKKESAENNNQAKKNKNNKNNKNNNNKNNNNNNQANNKKGKKNRQNNKNDNKVQEVKEEKQEAKKAKDEVVYIQDPIIVKDLAEKLGVGVNELITKLIMLGLMLNQNQSVDFDTASLMADEFGVKVELEVPQSEEEALELDFEDSEDSLVTRPPVVTVMGHVDHGKTSLLDAIRETKVQAGEAGGITQRIGAYSINVKGKKVVFLDTPGHEAFTQMRARGAQITDISVIVVAADDGIMPQTKEAISHSKAAGVPIIVAINKIDRPEANIEKIYQELADNDLLPEKWGGSTITVEVSAKKRINIDELLEMIILVAEMEDIKANPNRRAMGTVIEAQLDKGQGPTATVLVQKGTLKKGDYVVSGTACGKIRLMVDDNGKGIMKASPSTPVKIMGLSEVPEAGEFFYAVESEKKARAIADMRKEKQREEMITATQKVSLDNLFDRIKEGELKDLNVIIKADNKGSIEAISSSLTKLSNDEVKVSVIHSGVGGISESDVMLASASNAIIIGFNVRPNNGAMDLANAESIEVKTYRVIYDIIDDIKNAVKGMLKPKTKETVLGRATVRATFRLPSGQTIAGIYVDNGKITRNSSIRLLRDDVVIHDGGISSLKRFKDDAKEVATGYEAGLGLDNYNDVKEGDEMEAYIIEEIKA